MSKAKRAANHKKLGKYTNTPKKIVARQQKKRMEKIAVLNEEIPAKKRHAIRRIWKRKIFSEVPRTQKIALCERLCIKQSEVTWLENFLLTV
jgi:hypothetical protein